MYPFSIGKKQEVKRMFKYVFELTPKIIGYKLARKGLCKPPLPAIFNFSVTDRCQSRCKTCSIWRLYQEKTELEKEELKLWEIEKIFQSMDRVFLLNIAGGEPFLRDDLPEICGLAYKYLSPRVIHSPTNCLAPKRIEDVVIRILGRIENTPLTIKLSVDGVEEKHDYIRGVKGNFDKFLNTYKRLHEVQKDYPNFYLDAGMTISNYNINNIEELEEYVKKNLKFDNFLHEIADWRGELFNLDLPIRPTGEEYTKIINYLTDRVREDMKDSRKLSKITQALRLVYYDRAARVLREDKRVIPCYAGISNAHLNPWGGIWPCNVQAFKKEMGNVRDFDYDFKKLWHSEQANNVREWIKSNQCSCPLVGQAFLDTIMNPKELLKVFRYYFRYA